MYKFLPRTVAFLASSAWLCTGCALTAQAVAPVQASRHAIAANQEIRAIYFTGLMAGSPHGRRLAEQWRAEGGNAVVFDVKDADGPVSFNAPLALAGHLKHPYIKDLPEWVSWLHAHGLYAIARMAVFKDARLVEEHPGLGVQSRANPGQVWRENGKPVWTDPSLDAVQDYNIALAQAVAAAGVDEVQFDYIRFPVDGNQKDARFAYQATRPATPRAYFISDFLYRAQQALKPSGVHISIDVYGVMAWARKVDLDATGQDVLALAYYCDVMCPMIYPSHFFNFDGFKDPGDAPEHFIQVGMERFNNITRDTGVVIRPWLQAFAWRTPTFGPNYILIQVATERRNHGGGFMLWNANNVYKVPAVAMPEMVAGGGKYFAGGFPYAVTAPPDAAPAPAGGH
ncbi:MAG: putative glycoside hydrolase [Terriglobales bacterium]